jgi:hypothetical protein
MKPPKTKVKKTTIPVSSGTNGSHSIQSLEQIFRPLNKKTYKERCENIVPSIYLTFISIIEGVALGLLAQQLFTFPIGESDRLGELMARAPYALSTLLSMIIVTYEYIVLTLVHRYSYRLRDTIILFGLGLFQIGPIFFLSEPTWWWATNIFFCGAGAVAFKNESSRNTEPAFDTRDIYSMTMKKLRFDAWISLIATFWCGFAAGALFIGSHMNEQNDTLGWLLVSEPVQQFLAFRDRHPSPWFLLAPMLLVQSGILLYESMHIRRIHKKLGLVW